MTEDQLKYALKVASGECRKHTPPDPYDRSDLFQEILLHLHELCLNKGPGMPTAWMSRRAKFAAVSTILKWRWGARSPLAKTQPPLSFDPEWDVRAHWDVYELEAEELLEQLTPRQREYATVMGILDLTQAEAARRLDVHPSAIDTSMKSAQRKLRRLHRECTA